MGAVVSSLEGCMGVARGEAGRKSSWAELQTGPHVECWHVVWRRVTAALHVTAGLPPGHPWACALPLSVVCGHVVDLGRWNGPEVGLALLSGCFVSLPVVCPCSPSF